MCIKNPSTNFSSRHKTPRFEQLNLKPMDVKDIIHKTEIKKNVNYMVLILLNIDSVKIEQRRNTFYLGFRRTMITESPRRNILLINLSLLTGRAFFFPLPVLGTCSQNVDIKQMGNYTTKKFKTYQDI